VSSALQPRRPSTAGREVGGDAEVGARERRGRTSYGVDRAVAGAGRLLEVGAQERVEERQRLGRAGRVAGGRRRGAARTGTVQPRRDRLEPAAQRVGKPVGEGDLVHATTLDRRADPCAAVAVGLWRTTRGARTLGAASSARHDVVASTTPTPREAPEAALKLRLSPEDAAFREEMREFFTNKVPQDIRDAVAERRELTKEQIVTAMKVLDEHDLAVPHWPVEWGGKDWSPLRRHIFHEEMQRAHVPPPLAFNASMIGPVIAHFGSQEMKERFLPPTKSLDIWWSQGFSEPDAGSDLASLRTAAVRDGDHYVVNGQKTWTTLGQYGDWIFTLVRTDPEVKKQRGISMLLIDMTSPGVTVRPIELIDGGHEVNEVWFEDVRVPVENLVGEENIGWDIAKFLLGNERVGVAPVGATKAVLAQAKEWARTQPGPTGGTLLEDPLVAARFVELENDLLALELTALRVVPDSADGKPHPASSVLKLRGTELQQAVSELVVDLAGPGSLASGAADDATELDWWMRRATPAYLNLRKASIYGGSNEVQRQIIAKTILGL